jgi:RNA polymerase sigma factor for flagellar operon FliA
MTSHDLDRSADLSTELSTDLSVDELWRSYKSTGDLELRNRLVLQYAPLVKYVAGRVRSGLPEWVDQADLLSEGVIGLMDAIAKFEPDRGLQFNTYAVTRIRGAIIDGLRSADWVPRSVRNKIRDIERAQVALETRLGGSSSDSQIAQEMQISVRQLRDIYTKVAGASVASIDELGVGEDLTLASGDAIEDAEAQEALMDAVEGLPERDRIIVALYYFEGFTLAEIGQVLGVTESRVSQLHTRTTLALRTRLHTSKEGPAEGIEPGQHAAVRMSGRAPTSRRAAGSRSKAADLRTDPGLRPTA